MKADILIVGGTAAGTAAAAEARRRNPDVRIVLVDSNTDVAYSTCEMPMYVGGDVASAADLTRFSPASFAQEYAIDVRSGVRVLSVDLKSRVARTSDGDLRFDRLILATGARATVPAALAEDPGTWTGSDRRAPDVHVLRNLDDARAIRGLFDERAGQSDGGVHHAVIVGGGFVGLEVAHALRSHDVRVTVVQPEGHVLSAGLPKEQADRMVVAMQHADVAVRPTRAVGMDRGPDGRILALRTDDGEQIGCQFVLVATGIVPTSELADGMGLALTPGGAVQVNEQMRTSRSDVWACGDVVELPDAISGGSIWVPLAMNAFRSGRVAGANAARRPGTRPERMMPVVPAFAVRAFGLDAAYAGLRLDEARAAGYRAKAVDMTGASHARLLGGQDVLLRLVYDEPSGRVLGAATVGPPGSALRMNTVAALIRLRGTVDDLEAADTVYHPHVAPMHDPLKVAARLAQKSREER
ncbi:MAG: FAD-dependent oxidoreductase [Rhodothermales bacterium]